MLEASHWIVYGPVVQYHNTTTAGYLLHHFNLLLL